MGHAGHPGDSTSPNSNLGVDEPFWGGGTELRGEGSVFILNRVVHLQPYVGESDWMIVPNGRPSSSVSNGRPSSSANGKTFRLCDIYDCAAKAKTSKRKRVNVCVCEREKARGTASERAHECDCEKIDKPESQREKETPEYSGRAVARWAQDRFAQGVMRPSAYRLYCISSILIALQESTRTNTHATPTESILFLIIHSENPNFLERVGGGKDCLVGGS